MSDQPLQLYATPQHRVPSDGLFFLGMFGISLFYLLMIAGTVLAMTSYATVEHIVKALTDEKILFSIKLSLITCTISTILSLWVAVPIGYLMSRFNFFGKNVIDTLLDIPIILPPLVVGLGLLILFQTGAGQFVENMTHKHMGDMAVWGVVGIVGAFAAYATVRFAATMRRVAGEEELAKSNLTTPAILLVAAATVAALMMFTDVLPSIGDSIQRRFATRITHHVPAVVLAQFMVACAFAVRTMRVTFDQIPQRREQVAMTLGASRSQAFWSVAFPESKRGIMAAATLAWARSLGEFGPILVFASATRMRTEVLPTTVWLELQTGSLEAAAVVSLIMVVVAVFVLVMARACGLRKSFV